MIVTFVGVFLLVSLLAFVVSGPRTGFAVHALGNLMWLVMSKDFGNAISASVFLLLDLWWLVRFSRSS